MVAFVTGTGSTNLGLAATSLATIGRDGVAGDPTLGRDGEQVYLNTATGNVVVQHQDEFVDSQEFGQALSVVRTYNSYGTATDDNKDGWQMGVVQTLSNYVAGSSITRNDGDGTSLVYNWDNTQQLYVCKSGSGAFDTLALNADGSWTWRNGSTDETETYATTKVGDATLRMVASADREGKTTAYSYTVYDGTNSRFDTITDAAGEKVQFAYDDAGGHPLNIKSLQTTTAAGTTSTTSYAYDANNRLSSVTFTKNGQSFTTTYSYDIDKLNGGTQTGKLRAIQFADGSKLSFLYDNTNVNSARAKTITQTLADGTTRITQIKYNAGNTTVTDPLGNITTFTFDGSKRLTGITYPATTSGTPKVNFAYDANGQLWKQTDGLGNIVEHLYDAAGREIEQHSGTTTTDGTGNTITRTYDAATGLLTSETVFLTPDPDGDAGSQTEKNGLTTTYVYNAGVQSNGNLPAKTLVHFVVSPQGRVTEYQYDGYGRRIAEIEYGDRTYSGSLDEASLNTWASAADRTKTILTKTSYSSLPSLVGDLVKDVARYASVDASGNGIVDGTESVTEYVYDPAGRLLYTIAPNRHGATPSGADMLGTTHYTYDELGRVLTQCDATGKVTTFTYDDVGNKTTVAYANGLTTVTTYDATGQPLSVVNSGTASGTSRYWYDADGRLRITQDTTGLKSFILYDEASRKVADIDPNGTLTEYAYNLDNAVVTKITYATNLTATQLGTLVDASGNPTTVTLATLRPAANANDRKTWNLYDADGRLVKQVDELGFVTQTIYDGASHATKTIRYATAVAVSGITTATKPTDAAVSPATNALDQTTQFFCDKDGKVTVTVAADGVFTQNEYDAAGLLRHTVTYYSKQGSVTTDATTGLQVANLPPADSAHDSHAWYFYDDQARLVGQVDADGNLTEYGWDSSGNKASKTVYGWSGIAASAITANTTIAFLRTQVAGALVTQYHYTDLNQLSTQSEPDGTFTQYTYDAAGNLVRTDRAPGTTDARSHLVKVDGFGRVTNELSPNGAQAIADLGASPTQAQIDAVWAQYQTVSTYDTEGRKTSVVDANGLKTIYYYDNDGKLAYTINAAGEVTQNVYSSLEQLQQVIRYGTRLTAGALATLTGGLNPPTTTTLNIANAAVDSTVTYTYANDNLVAEKDANGNYTRYVYGPMNRLQYKLDSTNGLTAYTYDVDGHLLSTTAYAKAVPTASIAQNVATQLTAAMFTSAVLASVTDATQDNTSTNIYDALGRVAYVVSGGGSVVGRTYDPNGNVAVETHYAKTMTLANVQAGNLTLDPEHDKVCCYGYDTQGNVNYKAESDSVVKDAGGNVTQVLYAVTTYRYDASGNMIERRAWANRVSTPASHTVPAGDESHDQHERWIYDSANHVIGSASVQSTVNGLQQWAVTANVYDDDGNLTSSTRSANLLATTAVMWGTPTQAQVADWMHSVGVNSRDRTVSSSYDKAGRLQDSTDAAGAKTTYSYDSANRLSVTTVQGLSTRTVYDALGRAVYQIDPLGDVAMNTYDANGNVIAVRRYANPISSTNLAKLTATSTAATVQGYITADNTNDRIERRVYDTENRLVYGVDGLGDATMYTYDANGNVIAAREYAARINLGAWPATQTVANVAALITTDNTNDRVTRNVYDADDRLRYVIDAASFVSETTYDALGQVATKTQYATAVATSTAATVSAVSQALGGQTSAQHTDDRKITYTHYASGLLQSTKDARGNTESYAYDALGNKTAFTNKAGNVWTYTYDADGHMLTETDPPVSASHAELNDSTAQVTMSTTPMVQLVTTLVYTAFGDLYSRTEATGLAEQRVTLYDYDKVGRQIGTVFPQMNVNGSGNILPSTTVTYDALGNATMNRDVGGAYSYKVYDGAGRVAYDIDALGYVTGYVYDAFGEVKSLTRYASKMTNITAGTPPTAANVQTFINTTSHTADRTVTTQYDAAGHVTKVVEPQVVSWDPAHALSNGGNSFTAGQATATTYDAFGEVLKTSVYGESSTGTALTVAADTFYTYNTRGQQTAQITISDRQPAATSGAGYLTTMGYDAFGNVNDRIEYSVSQNFADTSFSAKTGMAWSAPGTDAAKRETTSKYDANNNKTSETRVGIGYSVASDGTSTTGDAVTSFTYDVLDNQSSTTDAAGNTTYTYRDALGRVTAVATLSAKFKNEQIAQAFIALLGRSPDTGAWAFYQPYSSGDIFKLVYSSPEGQNALSAAMTRYGADSETAFIQQIYQNLMGRAADSGGLASWVGRLRSVEASTPADPAYAPNAAARAQVLQEIIAAIRSGQGQDEAMMNAGVNAAIGGTSFTTAQATTLKRVQVSQLYVAILGRVPDPSGMAFYVNGSAAVNATMAQNFFNSPEGQKIFPPGTSSLEAATRLYENMYGQPPDSATQTAWANAIGPTTNWGSFLWTKLNELLATTTNLNQLHSFGDKVMAGVSETADADGIIAPLTEFKLDVYGNTVMRTDYATGAQWATTAGYAKVGNGADRYAYTQYDTSGHAIKTVDAAGKIAFSAYDAFGHDVQDSRTVTNTDGNTQTYTQTRFYDALGRLIEIDEPGAQHKVGYNAFGEIVSRSLAGDGLSGVQQFETDEYDNAGRLWRTNSGDGVTKVMLYDVFGHETSEAHSSGAAHGGVDVATLANAGQLLTYTTGLVRTDFANDLLGNVLTRTNPLQYASDIGTVNGTSVGSAQLVTVSNANIGAPVITCQPTGIAGTTYYDEGGSYIAGPYSWNGGNSVDVTWNSLAGLGAGDVRVELTCITDGLDSSGTPFTNVNPQVVTSDFTADQVLTGASVAWDANSGGGKVDAVTRVRVLKKDVAGDWHAVLDSSSFGDYGTLVRVDAPADPGTQYVFKYSPSGAGTWTALTALGQFGDAMLYLIPGVEGVYDYQLANAAAPSTPIDTGTISIVSATLRGQIAQLYATILQRSPDLGGMQYYLKQAASGMTLAGIAQAIYNSKGTNGEVTLPTTGSAMVSTFVSQGLGVTSYNANGVLAGMIGTWTSALGGATSTWGAALAQMCADVGGYAGTDPDMLKAKTNLANKVTVGLNYAVDDGGYTMSEARAGMTAINNGQSVAQAEATGIQALYRRWAARFYVGLLNRAPDASGLQFQAYAIGTSSLDQVANSIYVSPECKSGGLLWNADGTALSDANFVSAIYKVAGGRTASASDISWWTARLTQTTRGQVIVEMLNSIANYAGPDSTMYTARQVLNNKVSVSLTYAWDLGGTLADSEYQLIANSTSASTALASAQSAVSAIQTASTNDNVASTAFPVETMRRQVAQLFAIVLNRSPDQTGFMYFVNQMIGTGGTPTNVAIGMLQSSEGLALYNGYTDTQFVNAIFAHMGITPTAAQTTQWVTLISQGQARGSVAVQMIDSVVNSTDAANQTARNLIANKAAVGLAFALEMGGGNNELSFDLSLMTQVTAASTTAAMNAAVTDVSNAATSQAQTTVSAMNLAGPQASADTNFAQAQATYASAVATDNATPTTTQSTYFTQIAQLYFGALNRAGGYSELDYYFQQMRTGTSIGYLANNQFLASSEAQAIYGTPSTVTDSQFISKVYSIVLNRAADASGLSYYGNQLSSGVTRGQVLVNIMTGFLSANSTTDVNEDTNRAAFQQKVTTELNNDSAAANAAGYAYAADLQTASNKATADLAVLNAATSVASATNVESALTAPTQDSTWYTQLEQLYQGGLNRSASLSELNYYYGQLKNVAGYTLNTAADVFVASSEGQAMYGSLSNTAFINKVYLNTFGRSADSSGTTSWNAKFSQGWTRGQVMWGIIQSLVNYYSSGGRDASELQHQANFLARVSADINNAGGLKSQAQSALSSAFSNWVNAALTAAQQQVASSTAETNAQTALNGNADAKNRRQIVQLYTLLLNHAPDATTLNKFAAQMASGTTATQIATAILATPEAVTLYGSVSDATFFSTMWLNAFGHSADSAETTKWNSLITAGRASAVVNMASWVAGYASFDSAGFALESQAEFNDKVLVNMATVATAEAAASSDAARVLTPGSGHPTPLDEMRSTGFMSSSNSGSPLAGQAPKVQRQYDRWGNAISQTDPRDATLVSTWTYNANNQVVDVKDALGNHSYAYYDILGRNVASKDRMGNISGMVYDGLGNLVEELHADGGTVQNLYDAFGDKQFSRDAAGSITSYSYDALGRMRTLSQAVGIQVTDYTVAKNNGQYPPSGDVLQAGVVETPTETYDYDELGRRIAIHRADGQTVVHNYYDLRGNQLSTDEGAMWTVNVWDAYNHKVSSTVGSGSSSARTESWAYDANGRVLSHTDLATVVNGVSAGQVHTFNYDALSKQLRSETATSNGSGARNLAYTYDASSGLLVKVDDTSVAGSDHVTQYAYDLAANRTREKTSTVRVSDGVELDVAQDNHISYDALSRETQIEDGRYVVQYTYDANGNRIHEHTHNTETLAGAGPDRDSWYAYDAMNRAIVVDGVWNTATNQVDIVTADGSGHQGTRIGYNGEGNRTWSRTWGTQLATGNAGNVSEAYFYDAAGRLYDTWREGYEVDRRYYDAQGRILQTGGVNLGSLTAARLAAAGVSGDTRTNFYAANGQLAEETLVDKDGHKTIVSYAFDGANRLQQYNLWVVGVYANVYTYAYENWNEAKQARLDVTRYVGNNQQDTSFTANTQDTYDANGYLTHTATLNGDGTRDTRDLQNDLQGHVLTKVETIVTPNTYQGLKMAIQDPSKYGTHITRTMIANGEEIGSASDSSSVDSSTFARTYVPMNDSSLMSSATAYTVQSGDTLQGIAKAVWGDPNLWYAIAEANGFTSITAGDVITIPARPNVELNSYQTFNPYDPTKAVGDTTPNAPPPPPPKKHHNWLKSIVVAIIAVVAAVFTAGLALEAFAPELFIEGGALEGMTALEAGSAFLGSGGAVVASTGVDLAAMGAAAVAGAASSIAGQLSGNVLGVHKGFSWGEVAMGAFGSVAGVSGALGYGAVGQNLQGFERYAADAARATIVNAMSQGIGIAVGLQHSFSWQGALAAGVGAGVGQAVGGPLETEFGKGSLQSQIATGMISQGAAAIAKGGRISVQQIASDVFGNALGQGLVDQATQSDDPPPVSADEKTAILKMFEDGPGDPNPGGGINLARSGFGLRMTSQAYANWSAAIDEGIAAKSGAGPLDEVVSNSLIRNALYRPGVDDGSFVQTHEVGGHFSEPQYVGQAFVGVYSPKLGREFTQDDLNLMVAHSQFFDQLKDLDAKAAGVRYALDGTPLPRLVQGSLHSLNDLGAQGNADRILDLVQRNPGNLELAGAAMHPYADSGPHENKDTFLGHTLESLTFRNPDPLTPETAERLGSSLVTYFEVVLGVSADSALPGQSSSIRERAMQNVDEAIKGARNTGAEGSAFDEQFGAAGRYLLPQNSLRLPTLPDYGLGIRSSSLPFEALATTESYLQAIQLRVSPAKFLNDALDSAATIMNHYMDYTGRRTMPPVQANQLLSQKFLVNQSRSGI